MRIGYVWDYEYPWDVRTEKVCAALTAAGHDVHILARNRGRAPVVERLPEGTVHRLRPLAAGGRRLDALTSFPAFFNPRWLRHVTRCAREERFDLLLVRDLPLCPTALRVGRDLGLPVMLDMAENYPAMMREIRDGGRQRPFDIVVRNPHIVAQVERWCLPRLDGILVVVDESGERLARMGVPPERITLVSNTPPRARAAGAPRVQPRRDAPLVLSYLGLMEVHRGVGELVEAASLLRQRQVPVTLQLIGDGRDLPLFREQARQAGLDGAAVQFVGRQPHAEALRLVADADVGVIPHHADESWNTTIPNKLFDYMAAGLPVVSSDAAPCARILGETGAGVLFHSGDAAALADAIASLREPPTRQALGEAGRAAVRDRYNWEADTARLLEAVDTTARRKPAARGYAGATAGAVA